MTSVAVFFFLISPCKLCGECVWLCDIWRCDYIVSTC